MCILYCLQFCCSTNPKGKACHYYDIDYTATVRSLLVLVLSCAMIGIHVSALNYCNSWGVKNIECKVQFWDLEAPSSDQAVETVNALAAWATLGFASIIGFFVLACGCYRLHRYYAFVVMACWAWISYLDAKTLMLLYDEQNSCTEGDDHDRCVHRYTVQFYHLIVFSWLQTLVLLNCAFDSFSRRDELTNDEYIKRRNSSKRGPKTSNIDRMGYFE